MKKIEILIVMVALLLIAALCGGCKDKAEAKMDDQYWLDHSAMAVSIRTAVEKYDWEKDEPNEPNWKVWIEASSYPPPYIMYSDGGKPIKYVPKAPNIPEGVNITIPSWGEWKVVSPSGEWREPNEPCKHSNMGKQDLCCLDCDTCFCNICISPEERRAMFEPKDYEYVCQNGHFSISSNPDCKVCGEKTVEINRYRNTSIPFYLWGAYSGKGNIYTAKELDEIYKDEPALGQVAKKLWGVYEPNEPENMTIVDPDSELVRNLNLLFDPNFYIPEPNELELPYPVWFERGEAGFIEPNEPR